MKGKKRRDAGKKPPQKTAEVEGKQAEKRREKWPDRVDWGILVGAVLALPVIGPLLIHAGLPNTADGPIHLMRQVQLDYAWKAGIFYPRWGPDLALGHGMPIFHYAPPMLYHVTQIIRTLGTDLDTAMKGAVALAVVLYGVGMYLYARSLFGPRAALLAAAAYIYAPYRLREVFVQGNYGQLFGLAFYPLIFWGFHELAVSRRWRYVLPAGFALAGLLLSHNISSMLLAPFLGLYLLLLLAYTRAGPMDWLRVAAGGALGLAIGAFFWLPAFAERDMIRLSGITTGFFDFRLNYVGVGELFAMPQPLDLSCTNPYFPLGLGLAQIVLGIGGAALVWLVPRGESGTGPRAAAGHPRFHVTFFGLMLLASAFLATPMSLKVWEAVPLLELAEFPWRFLGPAVFAAAVLSGAAFYALERGQMVEKLEMTLIALVVSVMAVNVYYLLPESFVKWGSPTPADAFAYEESSGAIGTTSTGEFLPRWAEEYPSPDTLRADYEAGRIPQKLDPASLPGGASADTTRYDAENVVIEVESPEPFTATLRALYWPGWLASVDGEPAPVGISEPTGLVQVGVPAGRHTVSLHLHNTPVRTASAVVSVLAVAAALAAALALYLPVLRGQVEEGASRPRMSATEASPILAVVVALVLAKDAYVGPRTDLFRERSTLPDGVPAEHAAETVFGGRFRLLGYDLDLKSDGVRAGDDIEMTLYWLALEETDDTDLSYGVFVHLVAPDGRNYAIADERNPQNIPTSKWHTTLYVREPLAMEVPRDAPPVLYELRAGMYAHDTDERLETPDGTKSALLARVYVLPREPLREKDLPNRTDCRLGDSMRLAGYEVSGETITLYWAADSPPAENYTAFVHALDGEGGLLWQDDSQPMGGLYPTANWREGQIVGDTHPFEPPPGTAKLSVGMYDPDTMERLPAAGCPLAALDGAIYLDASP